MSDILKQKGSLCKNKVQLKRGENDAQLHVRFQMRIFSCICYLSGIRQSIQLNTIIDTCQLNLFLSRLTASSTSVSESSFQYGWQIYNKKKIKFRIYNSYYCKTGNICEHRQLLRFYLSHKFCENTFSRFLQLAYKQSIEQENICCSIFVNT